MTNKQLIEVLEKADQEGRVHLVVCLKGGLVAGGVLSHTEKNNGNTVLVANDIICDDGTRRGKGSRKR
jgi:hypothetical protein